LIAPEKKKYNKYNVKSKKNQKINSRSNELHAITANLALHFLHRILGAVQSMSAAVHLPKRAGTQLLQHLKVLMQT
jgi:hypothetical protein